MKKKRSSDTEPVEADPGVGMSEVEIDYNVMGSFPASDPPSWTLGLSPRKRYVTEFEDAAPSADEPSHQNEPTS